MTKDTVNIHGKEYETVASRVKRFRDTNGSEYGIITELILADDSKVVMKASIVATLHQRHKDEDTIYEQVIATGYAEESRTSSSINRTSALENCETSAIGRALAAFGMAGTEYASADEVAQAITKQQTFSKPSQPVSKSMATEKQKQLIKQKLMSIGIATEDMKSYLTDQYGVIGEMSKDDASRVIEDLIEATSYSRVAA